MTLDSSKFVHIPLPQDPKDVLYVMDWDLLGRKGSVCKMMPTSATMNRMVQVRFLSDGFTAVINRKSIRRAKPSDYTIGHFADF